MVRTYGRAIAVILVLAGGAVASAQESVAAGKVADMPVKEVTVFKDGHAFVLHEGAMPTNGTGQVVMDYLPGPVMGAFWPYSAQEGAKLTAVVAGKRRVTLDKFLAEYRGELLLDKSFSKIPDRRSSASTPLSEEAGLTRRLAVPLSLAVAVAVKRLVWRFWSILTSPAGTGVPSLGAA